MQEKIFYIKVLYQGIEKLRIWVFERELMNLLLELKKNYNDVIEFNKSIELQVLEENDGIMTTYYYDNINNIAVDKLINETSNKENLELEI